MYIAKRLLVSPSAMNKIKTLFLRGNNWWSAQLACFFQISTLENWLVTDMNASRAVVPTLRTDDGWLTVTAYEVSSPFWLAPQIYTGNRLSSYGSNLTYSVTWVVIRGDSSGKPTIGPNVILVVSISPCLAYILIQVVWSLTRMVYFYHF